MYSLLQQVNTIDVDRHWSPCLPVNTSLTRDPRQGYRGVVATKDIAADVVLVRVARSCCVGPETTDTSHQDWKEVLASADVMNTSPG